MPKLGPCPICGNTCDVDCAEPILWCTSPGCIYELRYVHSPEKRNEFALDSVTLELAISNHNQLSEHAELASLLEWADWSAVEITKYASGMWCVERRYALVGYSDESLLDALRSAKAKLEAE